MSKFFILKEIIFPPFSKRRLFAKLVKTFLLHPVRFISKLTPKRVLNFFYVFVTEGTSGVSMRVNNHIHDYKLHQNNYKLSYINNFVTPEKISECEPISFKKENEPLVSIIIPVFNNFIYTYNCLKSILTFSGDKVRYEIIIANDCSNDLTQEIEKVVYNINVVTTQENSGFLINCNNAAEKARGKYILFLNNDTQVQENWLFPLVELMESDETIGVVGSKLVYENKKLQEAGGIVWNDASAWNYGRMSDSSLPEFNYVKEVDYVSGASIIIKKSIWNEIGGFDERFAPAYYEDTDLCFSIRELGYKVVYQPLSVVIHFEGITNSANVSEGHKQYQAVNKRIFHDKWKDVLEKEHFPNGVDSFHARDRSKNRKTILFIDHYVPMYDKDAGSRAVFHYIKLFVKLGYNIKFIGDYYYKLEPYTTVLNQIGVEVLYGEYYYRNWKTWIRQNKDNIDYIFINRPHITLKYLDFLKRFPNIKIAYWGHDLRFLREKREYELTKSQKLIKSSKKWEKLEFDIMKSVNISYFFSQKEIEIIKSISSEINVKAIPINIYSDNKKKKIPFTKRENLLFVGGFAHTPNIDAVIWFSSEILPLVIVKYPNIKLNIIGSNMPDVINQLSSKNIVISGYLTDDELEKAYNCSRLTVVPLRYGAGVKGKIIEALYNQLPVITTTIGSEGILDAERILSIKDNPGDFADEIVNLYSDFEKLEEMSNMSYQYICENFSEDAAIRVLREDRIA